MNQLRQTWKYIAGPERWVHSISSPVNRQQELDIYTEGENNISTSEVEGVWGMHRKAVKSTGAKSAKNVCGGHRATIKLGRQSCRPHIMNEEVM